MSCQIITWPRREVRPRNEVRAHVPRDMSPKGRRRTEQATQTQASGLRPRSSSGASTVMGLQLQQLRGPLREKVLLCPRVSRIGISGVPQTHPQDENAHACLPTPESKSPRSAPWMKSRICTFTRQLQAHYNVSTLPWRRRPPANLHVARPGPSQGLPPQAPRPRPRLYRLPCRACPSLSDTGSPVKPQPQGALLSDPGLTPSSCAPSLRDSPSAQDTACLPALPTASCRPSASLRQAIWQVNVY